MYSIYKTYRGKKLIRAVALLLLEFLLCGSFTVPGYALAPPSEIDPITQGTSFDVSRRDFFRIETHIATAEVLLEKNDHPAAEREFQRAFVIAHDLTTHPDLQARRDAEDVMQDLRSRIAFLHDASGTATVFSHMPAGGPQGDGVRDGKKAGTPVPEEPRDAINTNDPQSRQNEMRALLKRNDTATVARWHELNKRLIRYLHGRFYWLPHEDIEDLAQQSWFKVVVSGYRFRGASSVYTYLIRTAINVYRTERARRMRQAETLIDPQAFEEMTGLNVWPDHIASRDEQRAWIERAIQSLNREWRAPFRLWLKHYAYQEIADTLEIPIGTVRSRISRAHKRVEDYIRARTGDFPLGDGIRDPDPADPWAVGVTVYHEGLGFGTVIEHISNGGHVPRIRVRFFDRKEREADVLTLARESFAPLAPMHAVAGATGANLRDLAEAVASGHLKPDRSIGREGRIERYFSPGRIDEIREQFVVGKLVSASAMAEWVGVSRKTLTRAVDTGRLAADKTVRRERVTYYYFDTTRTREIRERLNPPGLKGLMTARVLSSTIGVGESTVSRAIADGRLEPDRTLQHGQQARHYFDPVRVAEIRHLLNPPKVKGMISAQAMAGEVGVSQQTISDAIASGRLEPDEIVTRGRSTYYFFRPERAESIREAFNPSGLEGLISATELSVRIGMSDSTLGKAIASGRLSPDRTVRLGQRAFYYFDPARTESIRERFNPAGLEGLISVRAMSGRVGVSASTLMSAVSADRIVPSRTLQRGKHTYHYFDPARTDEIRAFFDRSSSMTGDGIGSVSDASENIWVPGMPVYHNGLGLGFISESTGSGKVARQVRVQFSRARGPARQPLILNTNYLIPLIRLDELGQRTGVPVNVLRAAITARYIRPSVVINGESENPANYYFDRRQVADIHGQFDRAGLAGLISANALAAEIGVSNGTIYNAIHAGYLRPNKMAAVGDYPTYYFDPIRTGGIRNLLNPAGLDRWISARELAKRIDVSQHTIIKAVKDERLVPIRIIPRGPNIFLYFDPDHADEIRKLLKPSEVEGLISAHEMAVRIGISAATMTKAIATGRAIPDSRIEKTGKTFYYFDPAREDEVREELNPSAVEGLISASAMARKIGTSPINMNRAIAASRVTPDSSIQKGQRTFHYFDPARAGELRARLDLQDVSGFISASVMAGKAGVSQQTLSESMGRGDIRPDRTIVRGRRTFYYFNPARVGEVRGYFRASNGDGLDDSKLPMDQPWVPRRPVTHEAMGFGVIVETMGNGGSVARQVRVQFLGERGERTESLVIGTGYLIPLISLKALAHAFQVAPETLKTGVAIRAIVPTAVIGTGESAAHYFALVHVDAIREKLQELPKDGFILVKELARRIGLSRTAVMSAIKARRIKPDHMVPRGGRVLNYFAVGKVGAIRALLNPSGLDKLVSVAVLAGRIGVGGDVILRAVAANRFKPDRTVPRGRSTRHYFDPAREAEIKALVNPAGLEGMLSSRQMALEIGVAENTLHRVIISGRVTADRTVTRATRTYYYFNPARADNLQALLNPSGLEGLISASELARRAGLVRTAILKRIESKRLLPDKSVQRGKRTFYYFNPERAGELRALLKPSGIEDMISANAMAERTGIETTTLLSAIDAKRLIPDKTVTNDSGRHFYYFDPAREQEVREQFKPSGLEDLMSTQELAESIGVGPSTIRRAVDTKRIAADRTTRRGKRAFYYFKPGRLEAIRTELKPQVANGLVSTRQLAIAADVDPGALNAAIQSGRIEPDQHVQQGQKAYSYFDPSRAEDVRAELLPSGLEGLISAQQMARAVGVGIATMSRAIASQRVTPDRSIPRGRRTFHYFDPARMEEIRGIFSVGDGVQESAVTSQNSWAAGHIVVHRSFGLGVIEEAFNNNGGRTLQVHVRFNNGTEGAQKSLAIGTEHLMPIISLGELARRIGVDPVILEDAVASRDLRPDVAVGREEPTYYFDARRAIDIDKEITGLEDVKPLVLNSGLLSIPQLAPYIGISTSTLHRSIASGDLVPDKTVPRGLFRQHFFHSSRVAAIRRQFHTLERRGLISAGEMARRAGVAQNALSHYVVQGYLRPDTSVVRGRMTFHYFRPERAEEIRRLFDHSGIEGLISALAMSRRTGIDHKTLSGAITSKRLNPDKTVRRGGRTFYYFDPAREGDIRTQFRPPQINGLVSVRRMASEMNVKPGVLRRAIAAGRLKPDARIQKGRYTYDHFNPARIGEIRQSLGIDETQTRGDGVDERPGIPIESWSVGMIVLHKGLGIGTVMEVIQNGGRIPRLRVRFSPGNGGRHTELTIGGEYFIRPITLEEFAERVRLIPEAIRDFMISGFLLSDAVIEDGEETLHYFDPARIDEVRQLFESHELHGLFSAEALARRVGVSTGTVYRAVSSGELIPDKDFSGQGRARYYFRKGRIDEIGSVLISVEDLFTAEELAREVGIDSGTVRRAVRSGRFVPDRSIRRGERMFHYFDPARAEEARAEFNPPEMEGFLSALGVSIALGIHHNIIHKAMAAGRLTADRDIQRGRYTYHYFDPSRLDEIREILTGTHAFISVRALAGEIGIDPTIVHRAITAGRIAPDQSAARGGRVFHYFNPNRVDAARRLFAGEIQAVSERALTKDLLSGRELSRRLGVSAATVRRAIASGLITPDQTLPQGRRTFYYFSPQRIDIIARALGLERPMQEGDGLDIQTEAAEDIWTSGTSVIHNGLGLGTVLRRVEDHGSIPHVEVRFVSGGGSSAAPLVLSTEYLMPVIALDDLALRIGVDPRVLQRAFAAGQLVPDDVSRREGVIVPYFDLRRIGEVSEQYASVKKKGLSARALARRIGVNDMTVTRAIASGRIQPDETVTRGQRTFYYFSLARIEALRDELNPPAVAGMISASAMADHLQVDVNRIFRAIASGRIQPDETVTRGQRTFYYFSLARAQDVRAELAKTEDWLSVSELAAEVGMSPSKIQRAVIAGIIEPDETLKSTKSTFHYFNPGRVSVIRAQLSEFDDMISLRDLAGKLEVDPGIVRRAIRAGRVSATRSIRRGEKVYHYFDASRVDEVRDQLNAMEGLISARQLADAVGVSAGTISHALSDGRITADKTETTGHATFYYFDSARAETIRNQLNPSGLEGLISAKDIARALDVSHGTVTKAAASGRITANRIVPRGQRTFYYFNPARVEELRNELNSPAVAGMILSSELARRMGRSRSAVSKAITRGRITPDVSVPRGRGGSLLHYFNPARMDELALQLGITNAAAVQTASEEAVRSEGRHISEGDGVRHDEKRPIEPWSIGRLVAHRTFGFGTVQERIENSGGHTRQVRVRFHHAEKETLKPLVISTEYLIPVISLGALAERLGVTPDFLRSMVAFRQLRPAVVEGRENPSYYFDVRRVEKIRSGVARFKLLKPISAKELAARIGLHPQAVRTAVAHGHLKPDKSIPRGGRVYHYFYPIRIGIIRAEFNPPGLDKLMPVDALARTLGVSPGTLHKAVKARRLVPDKTIPRGRQMRHYFSPDRVEVIRAQFEYPDVGDMISLHALAQQTGVPLKTLHSAILADHLVPDRQLKKGELVYHYFNPTRAEEVRGQFIHDTQGLISAQSLSERIKVSPAAISEAIVDGRLVPDRSIQRGQRTDYYFDPARAEDIRLQFRPAGLEGLVSAGALSKTLGVNSGRISRAMTAGLIAPDRSVVRGARTFHYFDPARAEEITRTLGIQAEREGTANLEEPIRIDEDVPSLGDGIDEPEAGIGNPWESGVLVAHRTLGIGRIIQEMPGPVQRMRVQFAPRNKDTREPLIIDTRHLMPLISADELAQRLEIGPETVVVAITSGLLRAPVRTGQPSSPAYHLDRRQFDVARELLEPATRGLILSQTLAARVKADPGTIIGSVRSGHLEADASVSAGERRFYYFDPARARAIGEQIRSQTLGLISAAELSRQVGVSPDTVVHRITGGHLKPDRTVPSGARTFHYFDPARVDGIREELNPPGLEGLILAYEMASRVGVSPATLRRAVASGRLQANGQRARGGQTLHYFDPAREDEIRELLKPAGLERLISTSEFAKRVGMTESGISKIVSDGRLTPARTLIKGGKSFHYFSPDQVKIARAQLNPPGLKKLISLKELAKRVGVSEDAIKSEARAGRIAADKTVQRGTRTYRYFDPARVEAVKAQLHPAEVEGFVSANELAGRIGVTSATISRAITSGRVSPDRTLSHGDYDWHYFNPARVDELRELFKPLGLDGLISANAMAKRLGVNSGKVSLMVTSGLMIPDRSVVRGQRTFHYFDPAREGEIRRYLGFTVSGDGIEGDGIAGDAAAVTDFWLPGHAVAHPSLGFGRIMGSIESGSPIRQVRVRFSARNRDTQEPLIVRIDALMPLVPLDELAERVGVTPRVITGLIDAERLRANAVIGTQESPSYYFDPRRAQAIRNLLNPSLESLITTRALADKIGVYQSTITKAVRDRRLKPDKSVPRGGRTYYYFDPARTNAIRALLNPLVPEGLISATELAGRIGVDQSIVSRAVTSGQLEPDRSVQQGGNTYYYFDPTRVDAIRVYLNPSPPKGLLTVTQLASEVGVYTSSISKAMAAGRLESDQSVQRRDRTFHYFDPSRIGSIRAQLNPSDIEGLISAAELARRVGVSSSNIRDSVDDGRIRYDQSIERGGRTLLYFDPARVEEIRAVLNPSVIEGLISAGDLARRIDVGRATISRALTDGRLTADQEVPHGGLTFYYFDPARVADIREALNPSDLENFISVTELAHRLGRTAGFVNKAVADGRINPARRVPWGSRARNYFDPARVDDIRAELGLSDVQGDGLLGDGVSDSVADLQNPWAPGALVGHRGLGLGRVIEIVENGSPYRHVRVQFTRRNRDTQEPLVLREDVLMSLIALDELARRTGVDSNVLRDAVIRDLLKPNAVVGRSEPVYYFDFRRAESIRKQLNPSTEELFSTQELARRVGVHQNILHRLITVGRIRPDKTVEKDQRTFHYFQPARTQEIRTRVNPMGLEKLISARALAQKIGVSSSTINAAIAGKRLNPDKSVPRGTRISHYFEPTRVSEIREQFNPDAITGLISIPALAERLNVDTGVIHTAIASGRLIADEVMDRGKYTYHYFDPARTQEIRELLTETEGLLTVREFAARVGVDHGTIANAVSARRITPDSSIPWGKTTAHFFDPARIEEVRSTLTETDNLLTAQQMAREVGVDPGTIRRAVAEGRLASDRSMRRGRRTYHYFEPARAHEIRTRLNEDKSRLSTEVLAARIGVHSNVIRRAIADSRVHPDKSIRRGPYTYHYFSPERVDEVAAALDAQMDLENDTIVVGDHTELSGDGVQDKTADSSNVAIPTAVIIHEQALISRSGYLAGDIAQRTAGFDDVFGMNGLKFVLVLNDETSIDGLFREVNGLLRAQGSGESLTENDFDLIVNSAALGNQGASIRHARRLARFVHRQLGDIRISMVIGPRDFAEGFKKLVSDVMTIISDRLPAPDEPKEHLPIYHWFDRLLEAA